MAYNNHVHIITMGGTIDKDYPRLTSGYAFEFGEDAAATRILKAHPNLGIKYDVVCVCKKDSQEIDEKDRQNLLLEIIRFSDETSSTDRSYERIVVTHGTDTMIETARYIQEKIQSHPTITKNISIAFTGATKPERLVDSDAVFNLGSAISITAQPVNGLSVMICMNGNVSSAEKCVRIENGVFCQVD